MTNVNIFTVPFCGKTIPCPRRIWMKLIIGGLGGPVDGHGMINLCPQDEQVWRRGGYYWKIGNGSVRAGFRY